MSGYPPTFTVWQSILIEAALVPAACLIAAVVWVGELFRQRGRHDR